MEAQDLIQEYKDRVKLSYKILSVSLNHRRIKIRLIVYFINPQGLQIKNQRILFSQEICSSIDCKIADKKMSAWDALQKAGVKTVVFDLEKVCNTELPFNNHLRIFAEIEGAEVPYYLGKPEKRKSFNPRYYYAPFQSVLYNGWNIHLRRVARGIIVLVKRPLEQYENSRRYKLVENSFVSLILYHIGRVVRRLSSNQVYLFYEKFSSKAEEGTFELFREMCNENDGKCYFVLDKDSYDYAIIKDKSHIITKYSLRYYWLIYRANMYIATEAPAHLNIIRSANKWLRKAFADAKFFFLQHGVTYLKPHDRQSTFVKGREGAVDYIVVNSRKEGLVVEKMLGLDKRQIINTGMAIFDKMEYGNINEDSEDIITIMLTWKPYEEFLTDFTQSGYYNEIFKIYDCLSKHVDSINIKIAAHPKVESLLRGTPLYERIWHDTIFQLIKRTKLLITDYSSICYQCFYRGAGVLFYQYDLKKYEENCGKLIPADDEYTGYRSFDIVELEEHIKNIVCGGEVQLGKARTKEFIKRYQEINEWFDGRNKERILLELKRITSGVM